MIIILPVQGTILLAGPSHDFPPLTADGLLQYLMTNLKIHTLCHKFIEAQLSFTCNELTFH